MDTLEPNPMDGNEEVNLPTQEEVVAPPVIPGVQVMENIPPVSDPRVAFEFHGETREYFRIWIVNTLLTLVTLGIFSAWAKVRKRRYFRGNTRLLGYSFDYMASPRRILIGNILVAALFLAYSLFGVVYPTVRLAAVGMGLLIFPWVIVRSLSFNAHQTVYRGIRFNYKNTYGNAAMIYLGMLAASILTLGWLFPLFMKMHKEFVVSNHRYGDAFFKFTGRSGPFYSTYILGGLMVLGGLVLAGVTSATLFFGLKVSPSSTWAILAVSAGYVAAAFLAKHWINARVFNHVWNNTRLDHHRFEATLKPGTYVKLQVINLLALVGSMGLLYPWATIRSTRYVLSQLKFIPLKDINTIEALGKNHGSAISDTTAEFIGLDFGL